MTNHIILSQDYYPFGMMMPGRNYSAGNVYRYGFNGKENDNEVKPLSRLVYLYVFALAVVSTDVIMS